MIDLSKIIYWVTEDLICYIDPDQGIIDSCKKESLLGKLLCQEGIEYCIDLPEEEDICLVRNSNESSWMFGKFVKNTHDPEYPYQVITGYLNEQSIIGTFKYLKTL